MVRLGAANTSQELSFIEVSVLVLIKQRGQIWLPYPEMKSEPVAANMKRLRRLSTLQVWPRFRIMKIMSDFLFSERPFVSTYVGFHLIC